MIHVDLDSPRVSHTEGEPLFREHGGTTEFLERMNSVLLAIHQGLDGTPPFIAALLEHELLESFVLDIQFARRLAEPARGFYTINEERLPTSTARRWNACTRPATCRPSSWRSPRSRTSAP